MADSRELLRTAAFLDDVEDVRKRSVERLRSAATGNDPDAPPVRDAEDRTLKPKALIAWVRVNRPELAVLASQAEAMLNLEHQAQLTLQRAMRKHPLGDWIGRTAGVGEKQGARLIAAIGDVAYNHLEGRPRRGPAELWAYCGFVPGQKRRKGVQSNWNAEAKMRAFLVAESCIKQVGNDEGAMFDTKPRVSTRRRSPYRDVYDRARSNWADREVPDAHKHAHGLRCVAKAILKDLFVEARRVGA